VRRWGGGVGRLSLARLVRSEEHRRQRSTMAGEAKEMVASDELAPGPEVHDASSSGVLRGEGKVGFWFLVRTTTGWSRNGGDGELTQQQKSQICTLIDHVTENTFSFMSVA
jgi:hypothetical protein